ncbi:AraC family transcriptional regulator [Herbaspirillum sp. GCM10030257]|uniref:helix-turn-helix transcriptional regulator n=1 Tax=Herbaspirillum sp. GCM10030257 TaxID=3273393 RepID=UPI00361FB612
MHLIERTLFENELLAVRHAIARPTSAVCSDLAYAADDLLLLPISGVFALHEAPRQHFIANPNHGVFLGLGQPYRMSFPGRIGDECLVLRFSKRVLTRMLGEVAGVEDLLSPRIESHCLLAAACVLDRHLLCMELLQGAPCALAIEEISLAMMEAAVRAARTDNRMETPADTRNRRRRQVEAVKEMITLFPERAWTLDALAHQANTSPYHLARVFREEVGMPVHRYLIRTRLGKALEAMQATRMPLTTIAHDSGFSHHSHFTSSFRSHFGLAPAEWRRRTGHR